MRIPFLTALLLLATTQPARAGDDVVLDLAGAVRIALARNADLLAGRLGETASAESLAAARSWADPVVEVESPAETDARFSLRLEHDLSSVLRAPLHAAAAGADLRASRHRTAGLAVALRYEVEVAYRALAAAEERLALARTAAEIAAARQDAVEAVRGAGNVSALEAARPVAAAERARLAAAAAELDVASSRERLGRLLGVPGDGTLRVTPGLPPPPDTLPALDDLEEAAVTASLDLAAARDLVEAAAARERLAARDARLPDLSVALLLRRGSSEETDRSRWSAGAALTATVPLSGRRRAEARVAVAGRAAADARREGLEREVRSAAREARARLAGSHARALRIAGVVVPAEERVLAETLLHYNAMQVGVAAVLAARRDVLEAERASLDARLDYWSAAAAVDALRAGRLVNETARPVFAATPAPDAPSPSGGH